MVDRVVDMISVVACTKISRDRDLERTREEQRARLICCRRLEKQQNYTVVSGNYRACKSRWVGEVQRSVAEPDLLSITCALPSEIAIGYPSVEPF